MGLAKSSGGIITVVLDSTKMDTGAGNQMATNSSIVPLLSGDIIWLANVSDDKKTIKLNAGTGINTTKYHSLFKHHIFKH